MHSSNRFRRTLAVTASGALVSALAWLPAGPAAAAVHSSFSAGGSSSSEFTGSGGPNACLLSSGVDSVSTPPVSFSSGKRTRSVHLNSTFTSTANSSDVTTVAAHFRGSLSVSKHQGDLAAFTMGGSGDATITRGLGNSSQCSTSAIMGVTAQTTFTEAKPGWLYVSRATKKDAENIFVTINDATGSAVIFEEYFGGASKSTERGFLTAGTYDIPEWIVALVTGGSGLLLKHGSGTVQRSSLDTQMTGTFYAAGTAFGGARGAAARFVRLPASISCAHHSAKLTWRGSASRVAAGAFYVNGKKKASVSNPKPGHSVVLRHLSKTADNKITARLALNGGGKASVTRAFVPCKD